MPLRDRDLDGTLPLLPETKVAIEEVLAEDHSQYSALQTIGLRDPAFALMLLRFLSARRPGAADDIADLSHVLALVGRDSLRRLIADHTLLATTASGANSLRLHYSQAAHAAWFGHALADTFGVPRPEQIALVAALANPAPLLLATWDPESAMRAANAVRDGVPLATAYGAELRAELHRFNTEIVGRWSLPKTVRLAADRTAGAATGIKLARSAAALGTSSVLGWDRQGVSEALSGLPEMLGFNADKIHTQVHRIAVSAARDLAAMHYPLAAYELVLLEGEVQLDAVEQARLDRVLLRRARPESSTRTQVTTNVLHAKFSRSLQQIQSIRGVQRAALFLLSEDRRHLRVRLTAGAQQNDRLRRLELAMTQRHLFMRLLEKTQSLWCNPANAGKYYQQMPPALYKLVQGKEFFAMSLIIDKRPLGILFADGQDLNEAGYRHFRTCCVGMAEFITRRRSVA